MSALSIFSFNWLAKLKSLFGITYYATKAEYNNTVSDLLIPQLTFNNLEIGKSYRISFNCHVQAVLNTLGADGSGYFTHDGNLIVQNGSQKYNADYGDIQQSSSSVIFTATATTVEGNISANSGTTVSIRNATLEELPNHNLTTKWD